MSGFCFWGCSDKLYASAPIKINENGRGGMATRYEMLMERNMGIPMRDGACAARRCLSPESRRQIPRADEPSVPTAKMYRLKNSCRKPGTRSRNSIPTSSPIPRSSISSGKRPIPKAGCRTATSSSASMRAAAALRHRFVGQGDDLPHRRRAQSPGEPGLTARVAAQARSQTLDRLHAVPSARRAPTTRDTYLLLPVVPAS